MDSDGLTKEYKKIRDRIRIVDKKLDDCSDKERGWLLNQRQKLFNELNKEVLKCKHK